MDNILFSWDDSYAIGVPSVDNAHKELFSVVARINSLIHDHGREQWACIEGIKYFKQYAIKHFEDEEAYMASKGYKFLEEHKKIHAELRNCTLPKIESEIRSLDYSVESVERFLHICSEWLANHIAKEDKKLLILNREE